MLTGKDLGNALRTALEAKGLKGPTAIASHFSVKPPSVSGWFKSGRISKNKLMEVIQYCSDVVPPESWGIPSGYFDSSTAKFLTEEQVLMQARVQELLAGNKLRAADIAVAMPLLEQLAKKYE